MLINIEALGEALVQSLNPELPPGLWLVCETEPRSGDVALLMYTAEGSWGGTGLGYGMKEIEVDGLAGAVESLLNQIQDDVAHASHGVAWPTDPTLERPLPPPWTIIANGVLTFGYGSLTFGDGIRLAELAR